MGSSFQRRNLRLTFQLATGTFIKEDNPDKLVIDGFRVQCEIDAPGGFEFSTCRIRVFGLERFVMERLSVINYQNVDFMKNTVLIEATDDDGVFTSIFLGEIFIAQADYAGAPDVPFVIEARAGIVGSLAPSASASYRGPQLVSVIMDRLAGELGVALENNGVTSTVTDMALVGSPLHKVQVVADTARIQYWYLPEDGLLAIAPRGIARNGDPISYDFTNGVVGWPSKVHNGIIFTALFNPSASIGQKILMESEVSSCNGEWYIISMSHRLDSETPGGAWFTHFVATPINTFITVKK
jgi:hypothetical protein